MDSKIRQNSTTDSNITRDKLVNKKSDFFTDALHIFVLVSFALAQPLLDILARYPEFFVTRKSEPVDIFLFVLTLCFVIPGILVLVEALTGLLGRGPRKVVHWFMVAALSAIIFLQVLNRAVEIPGIYLIILASALGLAATVAYAFLRPVRVFLTVLCPAILIFPGLFLFNSPVYKVAFPEKDPSAVHIKIDNPPPIIMVVFDEFPVISLMDENQKIDANLYPNFSALAQNAYWFRNATNVAAETMLLLPAILTGMYPDPSRQPISADYPKNLFTLLGGFYDLQIVEPYTQLCPNELNADSISRASLWKRFHPVLSDLCVVYLHMILPPDLSTPLPVITQGWKGFVRAGAPLKQLGKKESSEKQVLQKSSLKLGLSNRYDKFLDFIDLIGHSKNPTFYFLHTILPHRPWDFLPSGKRYNASQIRHFRDGLNKRPEIWGNDEWLAVQAYQRHLLQVCLTDKLLGKLMEKLKAVNLYDRSLIVVTADHGISFRTNSYLREVTEMNKADIMCVPLFIKTPNQDQGVTSDLNLQTIDILPTIADMLGVQVPWAMDGRSAFDNSSPERENVSFLNPKKGKSKFMLRDIYNNRQDALKAKLNYFGTGRKPGGLFNVGPHKELIGRDTSEIIDEAGENVRFELDQDVLYDNVDPSAAFIPCSIGGRVFIKGESTVDLNLAVGVNGTLRALTRVYVKEGIGEWSAMVPETAFRRGKNYIEVFLASDVADRACLKRISNKSAVTYTLSPSEQGAEVIISSNGESIPINNNTLRGSIDSADVGNDCVVFSGWAADVKNAQPAKAIVIFRNGKSLFSGTTRQHRLDIRKAFQNPALDRTGFKFVCPLSLFGNSRNPKVRIFALSEDGLASELNFFKGRKHRKKGFLASIDPVSGGQLRLIRSESGSNVSYFLSKSSEDKDKAASVKGTVIPVAPNNLQGHLDIAKIDNNKVTFSGWSADIKNSQLPDAIIIFVNGRFFYSGKCNSDRPDVAKAYTNPALRKSGFKYVFPLSSSKDLANCEVRIFAVSQKGIASELIYPKGYSMPIRLTPKP